MIRIKRLNIKHLVGICDAFVMQFLDVKMFCQNVVLFIQL